LSLPIVRSIAALRARIAAFRPECIALVPTMGALHAGHLALIDAARGAGAARVVASIFVNPAQFGPSEDFDRYPRDEAVDAMALAAAGCDLLFAPDVAAIYPHGFATTVSVARIGNVLDGVARPRHFDGVATVVAKLLIAAGPDLAVFGEKDWQQLTVIRRLVLDLQLPVGIVGAPIVRDHDGLALSSRNAYLDVDERARAAALPRALIVARDAIVQGMSVAAALDAAQVSLVAAGFLPDYITLVGEELQPLTQPAPHARLLAAARIGATRLIDNLPLRPS